MNTDEFKQQFRQSIEGIWNDQNFDYIDEMFDDNYVEHTPLGDFDGPGELRGYVSMIQRGFPDFQVRLHDIVTDGEYIACNYTTESTHEGEFLGVEPTGNTARVDGCFFGRIENGNLVEGWNQFDMLEMLSGLELLPSDAVDNIREGTSRGVRSGR